MSRLPTSFIPARNPGHAPVTRGAADYLNAHDKLAALLPTVTRLAAAQRDCLNLLPSLFEHCMVMQLSEEHMLVAVPNAAVATRLKQMLPKLHAGLSAKGWQFGAIRLKIQVTAPPPPMMPRPSAQLPRGAVASFAALEANLESSPRNDALKDALRNLLQRRGAAK